MSITNLEQVRIGIGDTVEPYILTDSQILSYLELNDDDVDETIEQLQPTILAYLSTNGGAYRTEDLWEDSSKQASNYEKAMRETRLAKQVSAVPIIGGSNSDDSNQNPFSVDMFDDPTGEYGNEES